MIDSHSGVTSCLVCVSVNFNIMNILRVQVIVHWAI